MVVRTLIRAVDPLDTCRAGSKSDYRLLARAEDLFSGESALLPVG